MPRLSDTMTEGKVAVWHKKVGDTVKEGDILAEIETDKAIQDFESEFSGTLLFVGTQEGDAAPVDSILAIIGDANEDISSYVSGGITKEEPDNKTLEKETEISAEQASESKKQTPTESISSDTLPENVHVITMPRLSDTMTDGKVANWLKKVGETVKKGELLAEIETDKAVQDFESEFDGVLLFQGVENGASAPVDSVLAIIGPAGTAVSSIVSGGNNMQNSTNANEQDSVPKVDTTQNVSNNNSTETGSSQERIFISPLAKKLAEEKGLDIHTIHGSGENGRIVKKDIENIATNTTSNQEKEKIEKYTPIQTSLEDSETPNSQIRTLIAKRLSESKFTAPHYYLMVEIDMDKAIQARTEINSMPDTKISFNDMLIKAVAKALRKHPQVNSSWAGDKIIHHGGIHIGVAVAVTDGLVVPVLKNTDTMSYTEISQSVKDLASRARDKKLKANEMEGSTFSISNLGMFGIETFTSIINQPNSAILSVGAILEKPIVKDGQIVVGNTMKLSMACDHRVIDGATGAEFLKTLRTYLEQPLSLLL